MKSTALELIDASRELGEAKTEAEREHAAKRFTEAERAHFRELGYGDPRSLTVRLLPPVLFVTLAILLLIGILNTDRITNAGERAEALAVQVQQATIEDCRRRNVARIASLKNLRSDRRSLRADLALLVAVQPHTPELTAAIEAKADAIDSKTEAIKGALNAIAPVAVHPGSPRADCVAASRSD